MVLILGLHLMGIYFYLYWTVSWFDILLHFLGGLSLGVFFIWLFGLRERSYKTLFLVVLFIVIIGVGWEIFEYINNIAKSTEEYVPDTILDLVMDTAGAVVAYYLSTNHLAEPLGGETAK